MSAYVITDSKIVDTEQFKKYQALTPDAISSAGGKFLVRGGEHVVLEGNWNPTRLVVLEFETLAAAKAFYESEKYRRARAERAGTTEFFNMVVVQGI